MEEPIRLVCPECDTVYRVNKLTLGKAYNCKKCRAPLTTLNEAVLVCPDCGAKSAPAHIDVSRQLHCAACPARPPLILFDKQTPAAADWTGRPDEREEIAAANQAAIDSANRNVVPPPMSPEEARKADEAAREALERALESVLTGASEKLLAHFEQRERALLEQIAGLAARSRALEESLGGVASSLEERADRARAESADRFGEALRAGLAESHARGVASFGDMLRSALADSVLSLRDGMGERAAAAEKLSARLDEWLRAREAESSRLEQLTDEIRRATTSLGEARDALARRADGDALPDRVAEEIGRRVEERVVAPMTKALIQQAPEILSKVQNENLADVVSRSVRDAQRPLLREIVAGSRGVPLWLFASLLIPLLLILGYLFLPGEIGFGPGGGESAARLEAELAKLAADGVPLTPEADQRLKSIESAVFNMQDNVWGHVEMAGKVEAEIANLRRTVAERDQRLADADAERQKQRRRIRAYEIQLTRLGISPDTIPDGPEN